MEEEDNGKLLDTDLHHRRERQQQKEQQNPNHLHHHQHQNHHERPSPLPEEDEVDEQMRMQMIRYWRSKSLPVAYLPPIGGGIVPSGSQNKHSKCTKTDSTCTDSTHSTCTTNSKSTAGRGYRHAVPGDTGNSDVSDGSNLQQEIKTCKV